MQKRNNWFNKYQSIGESPGQRNLEQRKQFFYNKDFINKTVLDIGCNMGQMCKYSLLSGANNIVGIDYDQNVIKLANNLLTEEEANKITYIVDDIDNYACFTHLQKVDTILLLSVIETLELKNRFGMLAKLSSMCSVMYFEGHINSIYSNLLRMLLNYTMFTNIEFKGIQYDNIEFRNQNKGRHIFRCSKQLFSIDESIQKITDLIEQNDTHVITIIGNGGVGKSYLKHQLIDYINTTSDTYTFNKNDIHYTNTNNIIQSDYKVIVDKTNSICIVDDNVLNNTDLSKYKYVIYFDYRALTYLTSGVNSVFFMKTDIKRRYNNRDYKYMYDRSPQINDTLLNDIENIYHIDNVY